MRIYKINAKQPIAREKKIRYNTVLDMGHWLSW